MTFQTADNLVYLDWIGNNELSVWVVDRKWKFGNPFSQVQVHIPIGMLKSAWHQLKINMNSFTIEMDFEFLSIYRKPNIHTKHQFKHTARIFIDLNIRSRERKKRNLHIEF